jgi:alpha-L-arabinofuranosidase
MNADVASRTVAGNPRRGAGPKRSAIARGWRGNLALASLALSLALAGEARAAGAEIRVQADRPGHEVPATLWGLFFEEINCAGDGGLYAELVRNRSFEDADTPEHWTVVADGGGQGVIALDTSVPRSPRNSKSLRLTVSGTGTGCVGVANGGYWGMAVEKGAAYRLRFEARAASGLGGPVTVSLEAADGTVYASRQVTGLGGGWQAFETVLKPKASDPKARLVLSLSQPGTVWFDMVSLFPVKTWKNRANGLRSDLAGKLEDLSPAFVRFPGGCWVEGDTMPFAYRWKETIGPLGDRRTQYNLWRYQSTHGLGYHEYLQMCEDLGAEPLFVINCGMSHREVVPLDKMGEYVQDALDAIEYANGPTTSTWGALRARHGHPAPFGMKYLEIGNENGGPAYLERWALFHDAVKARYPEIRLIANVWGGYPTNRMPEIVDEHYYSSPEFFLNNASKYDTYDRRGPKVYVGEYAVTAGCGQGNLIAALGEAAFMTGMERNSDVVVMASYAPLFVNVNHRGWNPGLINFDSARAYGTPAYYVQQLFAQHRPDRVLPVTVTQPATRPVGMKHGGVGLGTWATQAEYKDLKVTRGDTVLYAPDFATGLAGWKPGKGDWKAQDGALRQSDSGEDRRITTGDAGWRDYTVSVKARKLGGAEGFLLMFAVQDDANWCWWNVGGWGNTRHALERSSGGGKATLGNDAPGKIETGRWYDLRVELQGDRIRCFLDGRLVHDVTVQTPPSLYASAGQVGKAGAVVLKLVNASDRPEPVTIRLDGVRRVKRGAKALVLTSDSPADENSLDAPRRVVPVEQPLVAPGPVFQHTLPAYSLSVLRLAPTD